MKEKHNRRDFLRRSAIAGSLLMIPEAFRALDISDIRNHNRTFPSNPVPPEINDDENFINVTKAPFLADPTGKTDSTKALQSALDESRNSQKVCFFPVGTYLISDTISCEQRVRKQDKPQYTDGMRQTWWDIASDRYYILGSTKDGGRPVIKLSPDAKGFDDPLIPKFAFWIWAQTRNDYPGTHDPKFGSEQPNISFGHIFRGIDFDISGHPGAIGLRFAGSQGTLLMDCSVMAEGALAGFNDCPGQGGGTYNISTIGGKYGVIIDSNYRFPMLAGCTFKGQSIAPVVYTSGNLPLMMVGCYLESNGQSAIDLTRMSDFPGVSLVDCQIKLNKPGSVVSQTINQNLFMENVYITGAGFLQNDNVKVSSPKKWTEVKRYSSCSDSSENLINGVTSKEMLLDWKTASTVPSMAEIHDMHWRRLPSFEDKDSVNIKDIGAKGDGSSDDTAALREALKKSKKIFFPAGQYNIAETIKLEPGTQLFGIKNSSINAPAISTFDSIEDDTFLSFISVNGTLEWGSGKGRIAFGGGRVKFTENGGGRFYAMRNIGGRGNATLFEGTKQPIYLYTLNIERRTTNPQSLVKNVKGLRIFYFKSEASPVGFSAEGGSNSGNTPMQIVDSEDVKIYCVCGNVETLEQRPFIDVLNSRKIIISQLKSFKTGDFPQIRETFNGQKIEIASDRTAALFIRD